jgi:hypothetical protein
MSAALSIDARLQAFETFRACTRLVWKNADAVPLVLSTEEPGGRALASVACLKNPRAIGPYVMNHAEARTLRLSAEVLRYPAEALRRVLLHEAVHLGIGGHGARFRRLCASVGGAISGAEARGAPVVVSRKVGARFRPLKEFPRAALAEARAFCRAQAHSTGIRHRISY